MVNGEWRMANGEWRMANEFDVAIVGAGPAGCWAAYCLARQGARVALIDGSHPREKPCGGGVTGRALDLVRDAIDLARVSAVNIDTATFVDGARSATMRLGNARRSGPQLAVVSRRDFDGALLQAAIGAGASHAASRATDVHRANGRWVISTRGGAVGSGWLVGADGPNSLVRRRVFRPFRREDLSIAAGYFVHGASSREITVVFEHEPAGYLWSFPRPDHLAVGVGAQADGTSSVALLALAADWIRTNVRKEGVRLERYSWPIPSLNAASLDREQPSGDQWMLIGDAGGLVDPITREGIFFALASGEAAAASLAERAAAPRYGERIRDTIHAELRRAARLKPRFFDRRFTSLLVQGLQRSPRIQAVMADLVAGQQPYCGLRRRLLKTFELRLMLELAFVRAGV
jgi:geranylgeranyl reductase family protein